MNGTEKRELAVRNKHNGMNCCQAVIAVYAEELGIDIETAKKLGAAFGMGMGNMSGNCGDGSQQDTAVKRIRAVRRTLRSYDLHRYQGRYNRQSALLMRRLRGERG